MYRIKEFGDSYFECIHNFYTISIDKYARTTSFGCRDTSFRLFMQ